MVRAFLAACGAFLSGVVWMDLMFDVQALGQPPPSAAAVRSIAAYYRRVTTDADPMGRLIAVVMLAAVAGAIWGVGRRSRRRLDWMALLLALVPIGLAGVRVFPNAVRLGLGTGSDVEDAALAGRIARDHVLCFLSIAAFALTQVILARRGAVERDRGSSMLDVPRRR